MFWPIKKYDCTPALCINSVCVDGWLLLRVHVPLPCPYMCTYLYICTCASTLLFWSSPLFSSPYAPHLTSMVHSPRAGLAPMMTAAATCTGAASQCFSYVGHTACCPCCFALVRIYLCVCLCVCLCVYLSACFRVCRPLAHTHSLTPFLTRCPRASDLFVHPLSFPPFALHLRDTCNHATAACVGLARVALQPKVNGNVRRVSPRRGDEYQRVNDGVHEGSIQVRRTAHGEVEESVCKCVDVWVGGCDRDREGDNEMT